MKEYTSTDNYDVLLEARDEYFKLTGQALEEDDDYESIMNSFNDWYLVQFVSKLRIRTAIKDYALKYNPDEDVVYALTHVKHSLFEFSGKSLGGKFQLNDILHSTKIHLAPSHPQLAMVKNDLFLGRLLKYKDEYFLMNGMSILPKEIKGLLETESKKLRKEKNFHKEKYFLFLVENLKNKWKRYGHLQADRLFNFNEKIEGWM